MNNSDDDFEALMYLTRKACTFLADSSRIDVSAWKDAARAKDFRAVIRRAERLLRDMEAKKDPLAEDLDETIYQLKKALITGELERARIEEEALIELLEE